ncbi:alpha-1,6-mannosyltransferase [Arachnomyces sp. PD_36]|nr:alpha-1,6-mannosyltransferase [Arachnomyces sp. PD_36]
MLSIRDMLCDECTSSVKRRRLDHPSETHNPVVDAEFFLIHSEPEHVNTNNTQVDSLRHFEIVQHQRTKPAPDVRSCGAAATVSSHSTGAGREAIPTENGARGKEEVCFGMVSKLPMILQPGLLFDTEVQIPVILMNVSTNTLISKIDKGVVGSLSDRDWTILSSISQEPNVHLQLIASVNNAAIGNGKATTAFHPAYLSAIIYGPFDMFDDIGECLSDNGIYLQDPSDCDRNVRYRNPQRLSGLDPDAPMTFDFLGFHASPETVSTPIDVLQGFESNQDILEEEVPKALQTRLYKHQKQALYFMLKRERGWDLQKERSDLWSMTKSPTGPLFMNNVTGKPQLEAPTPFSGGILADHMGLGKTLSVISLIASDKDRATTSPGSDQSVTRPVRKTTLLVVPSSLLQTWDTELQRHLIPGAIRWAKHYGSHRLGNDEEIHQYDLVLTTLQTTSSEYRKLSTTSGILFSTLWRRLVLDEAHNIRNGKTVTAKAVSAIKATSRWAVTGTPIQNRVTDFTSLLKFLRVFPYSDPRCFESDIMDIWKIGKDEEAVERLQNLVQFITLRRSITTIDLPDRINIIQRLDFGAEELAQYRKLESTVVSMLDDAIHSGHHQTRSYTNALAKINILRRFCNLGLLTPNFKVNMGSGLGGDEDSRWDTAAAQKTFDVLTSLGELSCAICGMENKQEDELLLTCETPCAKLTQCLRLICATCYRTCASSFYCDHRPACSVVSISTNTPISRASTPKIAAETNTATFSTKVQALIAGLKSSTNEKSIVFSSWTSTLDVVQSSLQLHGIQFARVDGKARQRGKILDSFRSDPRVRVLLLTIQCGAEGLNLTAASCAYIMEPQWNPTIEAQALARVHRLGQTKRVTTVRFIMNDTIEDVRSTKLNLRPEKAPDTTHTASKPISARKEQPFEEPQVPAPLSIAKFKVKIYMGAISIYLRDPEGEGYEGSMLLSFSQRLLLSLNLSRLDSRHSRSPIPSLPMLQHQDTLRAMIPLRIETSQSCDDVLIGLNSSQEMHRFWEEAQLYAQRMDISFNNEDSSLDLGIAKGVIEENVERLRFERALIASGSIRFLKIATATTSQSVEERLVFQSQLLSIDNYSDQEAVLFNGVSLRDLHESRESFTPLTTTAFGIQLDQKLPSRFFFSVNSWCSSPERSDVASNTLVLQGPNLENAITFSRPSLNVTGMTAAAPNQESLSWPVSSSQGRASGSRVASAILHTLIDPDPRSLVVQDEDFRQHATYIQLTDQIWNTLKEIDPLVTQSGMHMKAAGSLFGFYLWGGVGAGMRGTADANVDNPLSRAHSRTGGFKRHVLRHLGKVYLSSFPSLDEAGTNGALHRTVRRFLSTGEIDPEHIDKRIDQLLYRLDVLREADKMRYHMGLKFPSISETDVENWPI